MSLEHKIISAAVQSREAFTKLERAGFLDEATPRTKALLEHLKEYYARDEAAENADPKLLYITLVDSYPKHEEHYKQVLRYLPEVSPANVVDLVFKEREEVLRREAASAMLGGMGDDAWEKVKAWQEYHDGSGEAIDERERACGSNPFTDERSRRANLIQLPPQVLQDYCDGGGAPGDNIIVLARPEIGKTAFGISVGAKNARAAKTVLHGTNEDQVYKLQQRYMCNLTGQDKKVLLKHPDRALEVSMAKGYGNITVSSIHGGGLWDIEKDIRDIQPHLVIIDQLRNVHLRGSEGYVLGLDKIAQALRTLAKRYNLVMLSLTQAGDSGESKLYLDIGDVDHSNTGIPAAADLLIGIGCDRNEIDQPARYFSLIKNKLGTSHPCFRSKFYKHLSRYE